MFREERDRSLFEWKDLGDIEEGRPNLGPSTSVAVYRLMQYTLRDVLVMNYGARQADRILYEAGRVAGREFCRKLLDTKLDFNAFISDLGNKLISLNVGILRVEACDLGQMKLTITVAEDLDCSGLPLMEETVCNYDEGFLAGILDEYTGRKFSVKEIDCWATGDRVCRFRAQAAS